MTRLKILSLENITEVREGERIVLLVPGENVPLFSFTVPQKLYSKELSQVIALALEDHVGENIEDLHTVVLPKPRHDNQTVQVLVTRKNNVSHWRDSIISSKGVCVALLPDYLGLPWKPKTWTICLKNHKIIARTEWMEGLTGEIALVVSCLLSRMEREKTLPSHVLFLQNPQDQHNNTPTPSSLQTLWDTLSMKNIRVEQRDFTSSPAINELPHRAANLLTGLFSPHAGLWKEAKEWYSVGGLVTFLMLFVMVEDFLDLRRVEKEIAWYERETEQIYRQQLQQSGPIIDLKRQVERLQQRLNQKQTVKTLPFLPLLNKVSEVFFKANVKPQRIVYGSSGFVVDVKVPDFYTLETLIESLQTAGLTITTEFSESTGESVQTTLILSFTGGDAHG